jgi:hypothetical protein
MDRQKNNSADCDTSYLLLIDTNGIIIKATCPFTVICTHCVGEFTDGEVLTVGEVISTEDDKIVFMIDGKPFYHNDFLLFCGLFSHANYRNYLNSNLPF